MQLRVRVYRAGKLTAFCMRTPLEFFFQEQSYSSLHSGRSLAWDHVRGDNNDPSGAIADFCGVIAISAELSRSLRRLPTARAPIVAQLTKHHKTLLNIVKHHETHVKHHETHVKHCETL